MMQYCPGVSHDIEFFTWRSFQNIDTPILPMFGFRAGFGQIGRRDRARGGSADRVGRAPARDTGSGEPGRGFGFSILSRRRTVLSGWRRYLPAAACRRYPVRKGEDKAATGRLPVSAIDVTSFGMLAIQRFRSSAGRLRQPDSLIGCADCRSLPVEVFRRRPWGLRRDCRSRIRFFCEALRSPAVSDRARYLFLKRTTAQPERVRVRNRSKPSCCARSVTASTSASRIPLRNSMPPEGSAAA